ncbi:MAG TPA: methyltransferase domain-containing protein [Phnomibacter sp.]|nr:methyltransferase domain-containing protein [Phnomibacter sp.]
MPAKWKLKAQVQRLLSSMPFGETMNYVMQTRITKTMPVTARQMLEGRGKKAVEHLQILQQIAGLDLANATFYEFGSGWDLLIPQVFYAAGVNTQVLIDIEKHARLNLINDIKQKINNHLNPLFEGSGLTPRALPAAPFTQLQQLHTQLGMAYHAPCDGRNTGFAANTMDVCTNTFTLEHIPPPDIEAIFKETFRILKPGGYVSCFVDMQDHYSYFDKNISAYNFLQFSDKQWAPYNCSFHYQNRLRHPQYLQLFEKCGFEVVRNDYKGPSAADLEVLGNLPINAMFASYSLEELGIRSSRVLLRKPA